ncbi:hypothetical protein Nepgr_004039 [Nepenthes gracilis]|uniref:Uncharacterized protein n=1 Tax=Nepenthes gracilis TaxID=150966 RepID=A0AAD3S0L1_NEPGR|nr:hypothetical protein Nepgr_004039 [Nepenthes gracilis]
MVLSPSRTVFGTPCPSCLEKKESQIPSFDDSGLESIEHDATPQLLDSVPGSLMAPLDACGHSVDPIPRWMLDPDDVGDSLPENQAILPSQLGRLDLAGAFFERIIRKAICGCYLALGFLLMQISWLLHLLDLCRKPTGCDLILCSLLEMAQEIEDSLPMVE